MTDKTNKDNAKLDVFRETPIRYLGYANEVGEAFRSLVSVTWVRASYGVASLYVCADAVHKGNQASELPWESDGVRRRQMGLAVVDTLLWQGLASVAIPGFTINRICWASGIALTRSALLSGAARKWTVTAIGLGSIPFIIKPIDHSVDYLLESTFRKWCDIRTEKKLIDKVLHHNRND